MHAADVALTESTVVNAWRMDCSGGVMVPTLLIKNIEAVVFAEDTGYALVGALVGSDIWESGRDLELDIGRKGSKGFLSLGKIATARGDMER